MHNIDNNTENKNFSLVTFLIKVHSRCKWSNRQPISNRTSLRSPTTQLYAAAFVNRPLPSQYIPCTLYNQQIFYDIHKAHHLSLSSARLIHSTSSHPTSLGSTLILSIHPCLGLPSGLFPSGFLTKTKLCMHFSSPPNVPHVLPI